MNTLEAGTAVVHEEVASTDGEVSGTITKRSQVSASLHVGPLPSPTVLGGYNRVEPGLAGRIVKMAEEEQEHVMLVRAWMEKVPKPDEHWRDDPDPPRYTD